MNVIVAVDENWAIGRNGEQLLYISEDLKRFKALTMGHPLILGRRTLATFPGGRPLEDRRNLVSPDLEALLAAAPEDSFVVGGASVYEALLDRCDTAYVTQIAAAFPGADCWFPDLDRKPEWKIVEEGPSLEEKGIQFRYVTYKRT